MFSNTILNKNDIEKKKKKKKLPELSQNHIRPTPLKESDITRARR